MNRQIAKITAVRRNSKIEALRELGLLLAKRDVMYGAKTLVLGNEQESSVIQLPR